MTELALSLRDEIARKHAQGVELDNQLRETLLAKLETTRQCGVLLDEAQDQFKNGQWQEFEANLPFNSDAVRAYLKFARRHREPITDLRAGLRYAVEAALTTGLLPFPSGFANPQHLREVNFLSRLTLEIQALAAEWRKYVNRRPLSKWPNETKEQFLHSLKPIFRIHGEVVASMKHDGK